MTTTHTYIAMIDSGLGGETRLTASSLPEALSKAQDWAREGDWEPPCREGQEHDWGSKVVWHGAILREVCTHCGVRRITSVWTHNPETGRQGLVSVRYEQQTASEEGR